MSADRLRIAVALGLLVAAANLAAGSRHGDADAGANAPASSPPLGTPADCVRYTGLPPDAASSLTAGMVHLPAGRFVFGSTRGYPDERPAEAETAVAAFWIDRTEVTNAQFARFVAATGYRTDAERQGGAAVFHVPGAEELQARPNAWWGWVPGADWQHPKGPGSSREGLDNQPVTLVTEADALGYAHWLGRELPTEAEWEYAAKGGVAQSGERGAALDEAPRDAAGKPAANYWQGTFPIVDTAADGHAGLAPVGCYPANAFGLHDMIGNAWEWTADAYTGPHQSHLNGDPAVAATSAGRRPSARPTVIKGGSYLCSADFCVRYRAAAREAQEADLPASHLGFRTVLRG